MKKQQSIHIEGRRWFQKTYGNTYNTVYIYRNGELAARLPMEYGYGDYYLQRAFDWLGKNGMPELLEKHKNGAPKNYGTIYLRETMHGTNSCVDVARQKDL